MAMTGQDHELRGQTGRGTPTGELLRAFWHPIAIASELTAEKPIRAVRILSENLVLYRDKASRIGLMQERCTHHAFPMVYGFVTKEGIACGRHGWEFDVEGNCFVIGYQSKIYPMQWANAKAYPVRIHAGLCWTYLGPDPAPPLPEHEMLTRQDGRRRITAYPELACNWLAADEAAPDAGLDGSGDVEPDLANLATPLDTGSLRLRMPVDDTHTWQVTIDFVPSPDGTSPGLDEEAVEVVYVQTEQESEPAANPTAAG